MQHQARRDSHERDFYELIKLRGRKMTKTQSSFEIIIPPTLFIPPAIEDVNKFLQRKEREAQDAEAERTRKQRGKFKSMKSLSISGEIPMSRLASM
jgi:hypothetical protein